MKGIKLVTMSLLLINLAFFPSQILAVNAELDNNFLRSIEKKVAVVVASALGSESSNSPGAKKSTRATGFFVSKNGLFLTSYHIVSKIKQELGEFDQETLKFVVYQGSTISSISREAFIDSFDKNLDLLSLNVQVGGGGVDFFKYDPHVEDKVELSSTDVYTYGYPEGFTYLNDKGIIKSFEGPAGNEHLWVTSLEFKDGQSGSPIFLKEGKLLGLVKGTEKGFPKNNFFIPVANIDHFLGGRLTREGAVSDSLLSTVGRMKILAKIKTVEPRERQLQRSFYERNEHCASNRDIVWRISASEGWEIDTKSITTEVTTNSSQSHFRGITDVNQSGFYLTGAIRNNGDCIYVFGNVVARDGRGALGVNVKYAETQNVTADKEIEFLVKDVYTGEKIQRELPDSAYSLIVYFEDKNGEITTSEGEGHFKYYSVSIDKINGKNVSTISIK